MEYNLAFSSSGARFAAHIGVLAYLQDNKIKIKNFSGTSGGAIVACWGANNLPARELLNLTLCFGYPKYFISGHSAFGETIARFCKPTNNLWIVTFNVLKMQKEIWNGDNFNLIKVLTATTCVPGLFKPVIYSNGLHIDGVFASFCPDDLWDKGVTVSVKLKSKNKTRTRYPLDSFVHGIENAAIEFLESRQKKRLQSQEIINLEPDVSSIAQTDLFSLTRDDHMELFKKGYQCAESMIKKGHKKTPRGVGVWAR